MSPDFSGLLREFNAYAVEYLVVGAHALAAHGHVRATKDLDVWVRPSAENATRVMQALSAFGAPFGDLTEEDLTRRGTIFQIGVPPLRIDVITAIDGVEFSEAWTRKFEGRFGDVPAFVLSKSDLIKKKKRLAAFRILRMRKRWKRPRRETKQRARDFHPSPESLTATSTATAYCLLLTAHCSQ